MIKTSLPIVLASKSPRRKKLLKQLDLKFRTTSIDVDENIHKKEDPKIVVKRLAELKMSAAIKRISEGIIITADTIVVLNEKVLGKPADKKDAYKILKLLSDNTHIVYTGFSIYNTKKEKQITKVVKTRVTFRKLNDDEIKDYIASGSPMDKAGAYGIQDDFGAVFIKKINGCYYNVVGLPLSSLYDALQRIV